jgi:hypothetical protein
VKQVPLSTTLDLLHDLMVLAIAVRRKNIKTTKRYLSYVTAIRTACMAYLNVFLVKQGPAQHAQVVQATEHWRKKENAFLNQPDYEHFLVESAKKLLNLGKHHPLFARWARYYLNDVFRTWSDRSNKVL